VEASAAGFRLTLLDDGIPFNTAQQSAAAKQEDLKDSGDRRVGLNLVGRLVDELNYQRTPEGLNRVELAKTF
jgi:anti-sigma regulatory factor (Ser/Thr protein kinase)